MTVISSQIGADVKKIFFCLVFFYLSSFENSFAGDGQSSLFKGATLVEQNLTARIKEKNAPFQLNLYLPTSELRELLGIWKGGSSGDSKFVNGLPNSVNMLLWYSGFTVVPLAIKVSDELHEVVNVAFLTPELMFVATL